MTDDMCTLDAKGVEERRGMLRVRADRDVRGGRRARLVTRAPHADHSEAFEDGAGGEGDEPVSEDAGMDQEKRLTLTTIGVLDFGAAHANCLHLILISHR